MNKRRWLLLPLLPVLAVLAWAALAPLPAAASHEQVFDIPKGTWARRMAGDKTEVLPSTIYLTLGLRDVLLLRNSDAVPQSFGPVLIMPGQEFRMPFEVPSENQFDCTAHASGQLTVIVLPHPDAGWPRLAWRAQTLYRQLTHA